MEKGKDFFFLVVLFCKISVAMAAEENPVTASAVAINVGVILDQRVLVGKVYNSTMEMALEDFYAKPGHRTRLVLHGRDSNSSITAAAGAGKCYESKFIVDKDFIGVNLKFNELM